jgi:hypothetical protein
VQQAFWAARQPAGDQPEAAQPSSPEPDPEIEADILRAMTEWERKYVLRFQVIYKLTQGLAGHALRTYLKSWSDLHPDDSWTYATFLRVRKSYEDSGRSLAAITPKWGWRAGYSSVPDPLFERFAGEYLTDRRPGSVGAWKQVLGWAKLTDPNFDYATFPTASAFMRRLNRDIPESQIYLKRMGEAAWKRKYGYNITRDYGTIMAGEVWCADHMQSDIAVLMPNGRLRFMWVTTWVCVKTQKWLGWSVHVESPNSDHIFEAFYRAASRYGIPRDVILDNGKDFRAKDLSGGRTRIKVELDERQCMSLFGALNVTVHFAWPYNAQSKICERTFSKVNTYCSRHIDGYRGPNTVQRPEGLDASQPGLLMADQFEQFFDSFIAEVYNREGCEGHTHNGLSPDQLWEQEYATAVREQRVRVITKQALGMFCCRASKVVTVRNCMIHDGELKLDYYAPFLVALNGVKVYIRRDAKDYMHAHVFRADTHVGLGVAELKGSVAAIARTEVEKADLTREIKIKRDMDRTSRKLAEIAIRATDNAEYLPNRKAALDVIHGQHVDTSERVRALAPIISTAMDSYLAEQERKKNAPAYDYAADAVFEDPEQKKGKEIELWGESIIEQEFQKAVNY